MADLLRGEIVSCLPRSGPGSGQERCHRVVVPAIIVCRARPHHIASVGTTRRTAYEYPYPPAAHRIRVSPQDWYESSGPVRVLPPGPPLPSPSSVRLIGPDRRDIVQGRPGSTSNALCLLFHLFREPLSDLLHFRPGMDGTIGIIGIFREVVLMILFCRVERP